MLPISSTRWALLSTHPASLSTGSTSTATSCTSYFPPLLTSPYEEAKLSKHNISFEARPIDKLTCDIVHLYKESNGQRPTEGRHGNAVNKDNKQRVLKLEMLLEGNIVGERAPRRWTAGSSEGDRKWWLSRWHQHLSSIEPFEVKDRYE
jgi:hypothetical protein